jgi:hypothetical protein
MDMGTKPLGGTLIEGGQETINYPTIYLMDGQADAVGDYEPGDEVLGTIRVRVSSVGKAKDGSRSANLEVLDLQLAPKDAPTAADKMYPSMSEK